MGFYHQYHSKKSPTTSSYSNRLLNFTIPSTSNFFYDKNDSIWNHPTELNLLNIKKSSLMSTTTTTLTNENYFLKVLPCIRRLYTRFNSLCPNIYRIHCSNSLRILQELICLIKQYFNIESLTTISSEELLYNEEYFESFISKLRVSALNYPYSTFYSSSSPPPIKPEIHCFGQGINPSDSKNQLNQNLLFCFELTTPIENSYSSPINVIILDPNNKSVLNELKYINTYDRRHTKLYSCSYKPTTQSGTYKISFFYNNILLTNNPYTVFIRNSNDDDDKQQILVNDQKKIMNEQEIPQYELEGDGYSKKVIVNSIARFRLRLNSYTKSLIDLFSISILDPYGHTIVVQHRILSPDVLELTYQPMSIGEHQLTILFNNKFHRKYFLHVINDETNYLSKLKPFGPGLKRAIVGLPTEFYIDLNHQIIANQNPIQFSLEPSYHAEFDYEQQMATVRYTPLKQGDCPIHIIQHNQDILQSPYIAKIKQESISDEKPRLNVTGLTEQIIIHRPIEFQISIENAYSDTPDSLHIEILTDETSPSVSIHHQHPSLYICSFIPITLGRHIISIDYDGIVAENNPFYCQVIQDKDIQLTGPAINSQCLPLNQPTHFYFKLNDFLIKNSSETNSTYESGYSSNEDTSLTSLSETNSIIKNCDDEKNYRVTITDGHGNIKPNILIKNIQQNKTDNIRVDFTPDEQILFINISCTW